MANQKVKEREKEQAEKLKALRNELEEKIEEQLPPEMLDQKIRVQIQKVNEGEPVDSEKAKGIIEALLFASSKPLTPADMRKIIRSLTVGEISRIVRELKAEYQENQKSFEILEIAGGFEMATRKEFAPWIMKSELQKKAKQVTQSALETLSILAYKQPITRAEIEQIRGVDVSGVLATLTDKNLVKIVGKKEVPGRPFLYGTTDKFLEHFGLKSLKALPDIDEIKLLVESSVKRDDLIGTSNVVPVAEEEATEETQEQETPEASEEVSPETN